MTTNTTPVDLGELRARLQPSLLITLLGPLGHLKAGDQAMAQFWGNGAVMLYPVDPQRQPARLFYTRAIERAGAALADATLGYYERVSTPGVEPTDSDNPAKLTMGELRARLQPLVMLRILEPVQSQKGRMRFAHGDLVMAQFWGEGAIALHPVHLQDQPMGWFLTQHLGGKVQLAELGTLKGSTPANNAALDPFERDYAVRGTDLIIGGRSS